MVLTERTVARSDDGHVPSSQRNNLDDAKLEALLEAHGRTSKGLIPLLQWIQTEFGYIPKEMIQVLSRKLKLSEHEIYGVATFYTQFKFIKPGEHQVKVCLGTACHVRGGAVLMETFERELKIKPGEATNDGKFGLERVACMGCCALAPVVVLDGNVHGKMSYKKVGKLIDEARSGGIKNESP
jgi:NADH-quinone oxidoreductase subunit E